MPYTRASLVVFTLIVSCLTSGRPRALADELPADTNQIESLTPEAARKLAAEFPGVQVDVVVGGGTRGLSRCLPLNGLKALDAATAKALADYRGPLLLNGLTTLDADTVKALAEFKGWLYLNGLTTLDADAAKTLGELKGALVIEGLTTLDADTATALVTTKKWAAMLPKMTTLDAATAKALAEYSGWLCLTGLTTLDADAAEALTDCKGRLYLTGLATLDVATAKALTDCKGELYLTGLTTLDADAATALAAIKNWDGQLPGFTAFDTPDSVAIAEALATRRGRLSLPNLQKISPKTLAALLTKADVEIPLIETLELIPEPDGSPSDDVLLPDDLLNRQQRQPQ